MLVLSRKNGERIRIGETIVLTVLRIRGGNVRIGIEAPHNTHIKRDELLMLPPSPHDAGLG
ncbi:MAG: carbon storage regulator [Paludisphaera borealis]|uniref:carbon storage regulator n=1 Tax=Paludisphaera borealis TaxID=1387353 RepID=UPI00284DEB43|nr:carbon storage regulator [Paludisphaera borealis]MDR3621207.1 carbon storage regulator [Paludisphaera borealis]